VQQRRAFAIVLDTLPDSEAVLFFLHFPADLGSTYGYAKPGTFLR
jgi:hypothetical protein